jgi:hypothetical protein
VSPTSHPSPFVRSSRSTDAGPRWNEPLSTTQNTRRAEAHGSMLNRLMDQPSEGLATQSPSPAGAGSGWIGKLKAPQAPTSRGSRAGVHGFPIAGFGASRADLVMSTKLLHSVRTRASFKSRRNGLV